MWLRQPPLDASDKVWDRYFLHWLWVYRIVVLAVVTTLVGGLLWVAK